MRRNRQLIITMDIAQQSDPLPTITNVGRQSKTQRLYFEGAANLVDASLDSAHGPYGGSLQPSIGYRDPRG